MIEEKDKEKLWEKKFQQEQKEALLRKQKIDGTDQKDRSISPS